MKKIETVKNKIAETVKGFMKSVTKSRKKKGELWTGKRDKTCPVCGRDYKFRLVLRGSGKDRYCQHDDDAVVPYNPSALDHYDRLQLDQARKGRPLAANEVAVKHDGVIHIVDRGG